MMGHLHLDRFIWHRTARVSDGAAELDHAGFAAHLSSRPRIAAGEPVALDASDANGQVGGLAEFFRASHFGAEPAFRPGPQAGESDLGGRAGVPAPTFLCFSSGSSGHPAAIRRTQASWLRSFALDAALRDATSRDTHVVLAELSNSLALYGAVEAVHLGASLLLLARHSPGAQLEAIGRKRATTLHATPTQLDLLVRAGSRRRLPGLDAMRHLLIGGSGLSEETRAAARGIFPQAALHEFYGLTETSFVAMAGPGTPCGSVGLPYPGVGIRIGAAGRDVGEGEICVSSPYMALGYAGRVAGAVRWKRGIAFTGDIGRLDRNGNLFLLGRRDRMVAVAGRNIHLERVEAVLLAIPGVERAGVVALADRVRGARLTALIDAGCSGIPASAIRRECRKSLESIHVPREVRFVAPWPLLPSGKTDLTALRAIASEGRR